MTALEPSAADRRLGRWLVLGLALVSVLFVTGTALAQRYEPLVAGSLEAVGDGTRTSTDDGEVVRLPFEPGGSASVLVTVRNTGRFAITVDGVLTDSGEGFGLAKATGLRGDGRTPLEGTVALPHRLEPGQQLGLRLTYRLPRCGALAGSATGVRTFPVRWHAFRSDHVTYLPMTPVQVVVPDDAPDAVTRPC